MPIDMFYTIIKISHFGAAWSQHYLDCLTNIDLTAKAIEIFNFFLLEMKDNILSYNSSHKDVFATTILTTLKVMAKARAFKALRPI